MTLVLLARRHAPLGNSPTVAVASQDSLHRARGGRMADTAAAARRGTAKLVKAIHSRNDREPRMDNRSDIWLGVDAIKPRFIALSDRVWGMPEVCYTEARSSAEHLAELRHQGFRITENVAGIPTAMMGEWGEGGPVIAFLGEYDALP